MLQLPPLHQDRRAYLTNQNVSELRVSICARPDLSEVTITDS